RAITTPVGKRNAWRWDEFKEIAEANGIRYRTYLDRITRMGWTPERAATTPPLKKEEILHRAACGQNRLLTVEQAKIAEANGISKHLVWKRVKELGWDIEKAITTP